MDEQRPGYGACPPDAAALSEHGMWWWASEASPPGDVSEIEPVSVWIRLDGVLRIDWVGVETFHDEPPPDVWHGPVAPPGSPSPEEHVRAVREAHAEGVADGDVTGDVQADEPAVWWTDTDVRAALADRWPAALAAVEADDG